MIDIDIQISISERSCGWATNQRGGQVDGDDDDDGDDGDD